MSRLSETASEIVNQTPRGATKVSEYEIYKWKDQFLDLKTPPEFHGARLSADVIKVLQVKPVSLCLLGPPGTGKTRMIYAMARHTLERSCNLKEGQEIELKTVRDGEYSRRRQTVKESIDAILEANCRVKIVTESGDVRAHRYDREWLEEEVDYPHYLAIDDIGCIEPNEWVREAIYHLSNQRRANKRPTIWTSNLTRQQFLATFGAAISSRILGGEVIEVSGSDRRLS